MAKERQRGERVLDLRKIGAIMQKNFIVLIRDKTRMIPLLLFPVFMILVFGFTSGNAPKHLPTAIILYEGSPLSEQLQQQIADSQTFSIRHVVSTEGEGRRLLDSGEVRVLIEIPMMLQKDIDAGKQPTVSIIVDESDSAVAATARLELNKIVTQMSSRLAHQKVADFQASVEQASEQLQMTAQQDHYAAIAAETEAAQQSLEQSKRLTDDASKNLLLSLPPPSIYVPPTGKDFQNVTSSTAYATETAAAAGARAESELLSHSSELVGAALVQVQAAKRLATQGDAALQSSQDYVAQQNAVERPALAIQAFTRHKTDALLQPLVYEEKPAYGTGKRAVDFLIPAIIALTIFQGAVMGMGRAVAGEKREGSLTRVFLTPTSNATIITGTLLFYIIFELLRSAFLIGISMLIFNIKIEGSFLLIGLILIVFTGIATSIGMILSSIVRTEPQYMAFAMLVSMPTLFLGGAFFPLQAMPPVLQTIAAFLPVTYAGEALRGVMIKGFGIEYIMYPLGILFVFLTVSLFLLFIAFKRDIE